MTTRVPFEELIGKTLDVVQTVAHPESHDLVAILFETNDGICYSLEHEQDCCEMVWIEELEGDLSDLLGSPIIVAEEASNSWHSTDDSRIMHILHDRGPIENRCDESYTWTFYKIATIKGWVDVRFYGTSNGYYSESVSFLRISDPE